MIGSKRLRRTDITQAGTSSTANDFSRQGFTRVSHSLVVLSGLAASLILPVQLGCGDASSASLHSSAGSKTPTSFTAEKEEPAAASVASTDEVGSLKESSPQTNSDAPEAVQLDSDSSSSSPAPSSEDTASADAANQAASDTEAPVRPMTVALVNAEQTAETAKKPAAAEKKNPGKAADPNRTQNYSFDDLKFDIEKDAPFERSMLPQKIEDYAGQRVSIRGFILPTSFQTGLTNFVLVRDNMECCFGPGAALYDCVVIEMAEGKSTDYTIRPVTVEGRFSIDEVIGPGRRHLAIYKIVADKVE